MSDVSRMVRLVPIWSATFYMKTMFGSDLIYRKYDRSCGSDVSWVVPTGADVSESRFV